MRRQLSVSVFSGVDRARRRQQSEPGPLPVSEPSRAAAPWSMPMRSSLGSETGTTAQASPLEMLARAEVIVVGVPGIGKMAICEFLSRHGLRAVPVELERGRVLPEAVMRARGLVIGVMMRPDRLIAERRMRTAAQPDRSADIDPPSVREELIAARRLFTAAGWHIIDISHQSSSAVAARIIALWQRRQAEKRARNETDPAE